ncbi:phosphatase PAP2 family protein [Streptomyces sp. 7N604]|uniref:phosphatase PAP2 family protein n=1 Tax=Streptomyces sp. 7N604 TaxID=3457415 RepID=UPI003FD4747C
MDAPPPRSPARCLWTAAVCGLLGFFVLVLVAVPWQPLLTWDQDVADGLHGSAVGHPGWVGTNEVLTDWVWDPWTMRALLALAALLLLWGGDWVTAAWVAVTAVVATGVQNGLKAAVGRQRPRWPDPVDTADYAAFPSGHAMTAALACSLLLWLALRAGLRGWWLRAAAAVAVASVVGVGFTRLYLGVHWLSDVLGGWLFGVALAALAAAACTRWGPARPGRDVPLSGRG